VLAKNNLLDAKLSQNTTVDSNQLINNYMALTLSYINNNMFDEAITSCEAILKINPNHAISYNNICVAYNGLRLWDKAIIAAQKAIAIDPNFQLAKNNLAWAKSQKEQANLSK
jgi:tetratricopeptide (TPR) repeat protein